MGPGTLTGETGLALPEFDDPPADPVALMSAWLDSATTRGVREPLAVSLATVDGDGRVSSRTLLLKSVDRRGLLFGSHRGSRKGRDLAVRPWGAMTFYWRETLQQINLAGPVTPTDDAESDRLFAARPPAARATTAVSRQSEPLDDEATLRHRAAALAAAGPVERPPGWGGYRLLPEWIEFWYGSPDRLHRRLRYDRAGEGWTAVRLQP